MRLAGGVDVVEVRILMVLLVRVVALTVVTEE